jgi:O-acetyl-ADP-ribose deacetylase (regulator of RNase III)
MTWHNGRLEALSGDITTFDVDAIVNAANSTLLGGGGVDGAIHAAGGPEIMEDCRRIRKDRYPRGMPAGEAVVTGAGKLPCKYVIHTVGPVWSGGGSDEDQILAAAYRNSLDLAAEIGAHTLAYPAISTGVYGYPKDLAAKVAWKSSRPDCPTTVSRRRSSWSSTPSRTSWLSWTPSPNRKNPRSAMGVPSLNWREIDAILTELELEGHWLRRIRQPDYHRIILEFAGEGGPTAISIVLSPPFVRIHRIGRDSPLPRALPKPPRFAAVLKSRLSGARLRSVGQLGRDRIVRFDFTSGNEILHLDAKLWGKRFQSDFDQ